MRLRALCADADLAPVVPAATAGSRFGANWAQRRIAVLRSGGGSTHLGTQRDARGGRGTEVGLWRCRGGRAATECATADRLSCRESTKNGMPRRGEGAQGTSFQTGALNFGGPTTAPRTGDPNFSAIWLAGATPERPFSPNPTAEGGARF